MAMPRDLHVRITADASPFISEVKRARRAVDRLSKAGARAELSGALLALFTIAALVSIAGRVTVAGVAGVAVAHILFYALRTSRWMRKRGWLQ